MVGLLVQQCDDSPDINRLNQEFEIQEDQLITIELEDEDKAYINVQMLSIQESRCPANASCVRYGEAIVSLAANGVEETVHTFDLCIGDCPQQNEGFKETDTVSVQLDGSNYRIILLEVNPYPTTLNMQDPRRALLKVISG